MDLHVYSPPGFNRQSYWKFLVWSLAGVAFLLWIFLDAVAQPCPTMSQQAWGDRLVYSSASVHPDDAGLLQNLRTGETHPLTECERTSKQCLCGCVCVCQVCSIRYIHIYIYIYTIHYTCIYICRYRYSYRIVSPYGWLCAIWCYLVLSGAICYSSGLLLTAQAPARRGHWSFPQRQGRTMEDAQGAVASSSICASIRVRVYTYKYTCYIFIIWIYNMWRFYNM